MNEFDQRQLKKMQIAIKDFKKESTTLSSFIATLEFLFHTLTSIDDNWDDMFLQEIAELESINSGIPKTVTEETIKKLIFASVLNIDKLVNEKISNTNSQDLVE